MASSSAPNSNDVTVLWDMNTAPVSQDYEMKNFVKSINAALGAVREVDPQRPKYALGNSRFVVGDFKKYMTVRQKNVLTREHGFEKANIKERVFKCRRHNEPNTSLTQKPSGGAPNLELTSELFKFVTQYAPRNILFITGDHNFSGVMNVLRWEKFTVFVAFHPNSVVEELCAASTFGWVWKEDRSMMHGLKPDYSAPRM